MKRYVNFEGMSIKRTRAPTSFGASRVHLSIFDVAWALASPLIALYLRDAFILSYSGIPTVTLYCTISLIISIAAFLIFRLSDGIARYFSVRDAFDVMNAVVLVGLVTCTILFVFTRLDGIPRSTPVIHALILGAGLIFVRVFSRILTVERVTGIEARPAVDFEHIVVIGSNRLSLLYIGMLDELRNGRQRVIALLDDDPRMVGRTISGVRVTGTPHQLNSVLEEFSVHGIRADKVVVAGDVKYLGSAFGEIGRICSQRDLSLQFIPELLGLSSVETDARQNNTLAEQSFSLGFNVPKYFLFKPYIDFFGALLAIILLSPSFVICSALALFDVGLPVLFWQERLGRNGHPFLLHKIRTLKAPFDANGKAVPEHKRLSKMGRFLRASGMDEIPQLLNVLVGDMSLIGPRPLLLRDQPSNPRVRLLVRPGITGWAQVNGARLLTPDEKDALDEWYIRNASLLVDLRIICMTFGVLLSGSRQKEASVVTATDREEAKLAWQNRAVPEKRFGGN